VSTGFAPKCFVHRAAPIRGAPLEPVQIGPRDGESDLSRGREWFAGLDRYRRDASDGETSTAAGSTPGEFIFGERELCLAPEARGNAAVLGVARLHSGRA
jgi:hypothetical protein